MTSSVYGRFVLEEGGDRVRLGVRSTDALSWLRIASLVMLVVFVVEPGLVVGPPPQRGPSGDGTSTFLCAVLQLAVLVAVMGIGLRDAYAKGRARSRHARVRRAIDARWGAMARGEGPFREAAAGPACSVDGRQFAPADFVGVVMFESTEYKQPGSKNPETTERYRPTLVMRDCLFELDVFEQADAADARELGDSLASSLARRRTKAPVVRWTGPGQVTGGVGWVLLQMGLFFAALFLWGPFAWAHPSRLYVASIALLVFGAGGLLAGDRLSRQLERRFSSGAHDLVAKARAALASGS